MDMDRRTFAMGVAVLPLAGCVTGRGFNAASPVAYDDVLMQLKHDIGTYMFRHKDEVPVVAQPASDATAEEKASYWENVRQKLARPPGPGEKCLTQVSFTVSKVKVKIAAAAEDTGSGSLELKVPIAGATFTPGVGGGKTRKHSLETSLTVYPAASEEPIGPPPPAPPTFEGTPITDTLEAMAKSMRRAASVEPCFEFDRDAGAQDNTVTYGFSVERSRKVSGKLEIFIFTLGADREIKHSVANTIEITFIGVGGFG